MHPACTTIAGRHAADQQREIEREEALDRQNHARHEFDQVLRLHGLKTAPHFDVEPDEEKVLYVTVAFATARRERVTIAGLLEQKDWSADPDRLQRITFSLETLRLKHKPTGARMTVVIRIPTGESMDAPEAA